MGEIADLMLEGEICEVCGMELGGHAPGYPRRCKGCRSPEDNGYRRPAPRQTGPQHPHAPLSAKALKWLRAAARGAGSGMYPGEYWDAAPGTFLKLRKRGLVDEFQPHNDVHKVRAVITDKGRAALDAATKGEG